jgi:hypothetical protein
MRVVALLFGIALCFVGACNALTAFVDPKPTRALGGAVFALLFLLLGVPLFVVGVRRRVALPSVADDLRPCPHCAERIQMAARVCRFCQRDVPPAVVTT